MGLWIPIGFAAELERLDAFGECRLFGPSGFIAVGTIDRAELVCALLRNALNYLPRQAEDESACRETAGSRFA
jgi:hypothetical protein